MFQYEPKYTENKFWNETDSIFMCWIGINDITILSLLYSNDTNWNQTLLPRFDKYFQLMGNLYNTGARKFFLVNMPPLDRTPMIMNHTDDIVANFKDGVDVFNNVLLPRYVSWFEGNHSDVSSDTLRARTVLIMSGVAEPNAHLRCPRSLRSSS